MRNILFQAEFFEENEASFFEIEDNATDEQISALYMDWVALNFNGGWYDGEKSKEKEFELYLIEQPDMKGE